MVDTVILRIHDLRHHEKLVKYIEGYENGYRSGDLAVSEETKNFYEKIPFLRPKHKIELMMLDKNTEFLQKHTSKKIQCKSNHYKINFFINHLKDYIEINVSLPKYLFGTNVLMLTTYPGLVNFEFNKNSDLKTAFREAWNWLMASLLKFLENELVTDKLDVTKIEINRIDLCFNQVFRTKEEALNYLEYQKSLKKKYQRDESNSFREYDTSFMLTTKRYSVKVYHKGSEYSKNDLKEHEKINIEKRDLIFYTSNLKEFSDKMLRYEICIRNSMLTYIFKRKLFRKKCPFFLIEKEIHRKVELQKTANEKIRDKADKFKTSEARLKYLKKNPFIRIPASDKLIYKKVEKLINRKSIFMLKVDKEVKEYNSISKHYNFYEERAHFSKELFEECLIKFLEFIREFQIKEKPEEHTIVELIDNYNSYNSEKLPKNEMLKFYALLKNKSFDQIKKSGLYSKATFYRYKNRFKKIGITQQNLIPPKSEISAPLNLSEYNRFILNNKLTKYI